MKKSNVNVSCENGSAVIRHPSRNWQKSPPENIQRVARDAMPREVATEMLCAPKARSSNRERKVWQDARATIYESTRQPKPLEEKVATKLKGYTWKQINTWLKRVIEKRAMCQRHFQLLKRRATKLASNDPVLALLDRQLAALDLQANGLDAYRDALETEIKRRQDFITSLREVSESVANAVQTKLVGELATV